MVDVKLDIVIKQLRRIKAKLDAEPPQTPQLPGSVPNSPNSQNSPHSPQSPNSFNSNSDFHCSESSH